jgi:predicted transcriptional regulator
MQQKNLNVGKSTTMTVRIPSEVSSKLDGLARDTKRSKAYLAGEAITSYVERNAWQVARIKAALAEAESGAPGIPHEDMELWTNSWGTDHELPPPEPKA